MLYFDPELNTIYVAVGGSVVNIRYAPVPGMVDVVSRTVHANT